MTGHISFETVTDTWQRMAETPIDEAQQMVDQMEKEQPAVLVFLLGLDEYPFNQNEREIIFYIGTVIWEIMKNSQLPLKEVPPETLTRMEEKNFKFLETLSEDTEADFMNATRTLIESYEEPEVLRYLVEALMEDVEEIDEEDLWVEEGEDLVPPDTNGNGSPRLDFSIDALDVTDESLIPGFEDEEDDIDAEEYGDDYDEEDYEDEDFRDENRGMAFVLLKTVIDSFIESRG